MKKNKAVSFLKKIDLLFIILLPSRIIQNAGRCFMTSKAVIFSLALMATAAFTGGAQAADRQLSFYNTHTKENQIITYKRDGNYDREGIRAINLLLRDHRTGDVANIKPELLDVLYGIKTDLETKKPSLNVTFHIVSGFRSPKTNEMLRKNVGGQAKNSRHTHGDAIDIRVPGVTTKELRNAAWCQNKGGVGYYTGNQFVHVDVYKKRTPDQRFSGGSRYRAWGWSPVPGMCGGQTSS